LTNHFHIIPRLRTNGALPLNPPPPLAIYLHGVVDRDKFTFTFTFSRVLFNVVVKCYIWSIALYVVETWTLRAVDQKLLENFEMWCWRSWTEHVRNESVLLRAKEQRNSLHEISKQKANWIGHILCRNCLLRQVIEGKLK
jgi:hypothetical protein